MRFRPLPSTFHAANRRRLAESIGTDAIAILDTADVLTRSGDFEYPFRPDSNFYYLTGIDQPEAVLVLIPGHANPSMREVLFIRETNDFIAQWEGNRYTQGEAASVSGIQCVFWLDDLTHIISRLTDKYQTIYLNTNSGVGNPLTSPSARRARELRDQLPTHQLRSAVHILGPQRAVKAPEEIEQIRRAVEVTRLGLLKAWAVTRPGAREYEIDAELTAEFLRQGAHGHGFYPIIASGHNATVMHYMKNDAIVGEGDLVLFDVGADVGYYSSDISRAVPASGHFTGRQREVYEALLRVQRAGILLNKPGASTFEIDEKMRGLLREELAPLGLIKKGQNDIPKMLSIPHSSHHLGLDLHDSPDPRTAFTPGMVVTCEPGIYLVEEGIGIRLEDDLLITEDGCEVLSRDIPSDPDELEKLLLR